jgi:hypothetical protein
MIFAEFGCHKYREKVPRAALKTNQLAKNHFFGEKSFPFKSCLEEARKAIEAGSEI